MRRYVRNPLFLFYLLVLYVVTQFAWWLYLIASLYGKIYTDETLLQKKTMMLVGEGSVFVVILFGGVFMIRRAYQKEQRLNKIQESFLLSVSHELKTPVSSVTLFLQTLQKHDLDAAKKDEIYNQSLAEMKRLDSLIANLLITRSIENRNYFLTKVDFRLDELVNDVVATMNRTLLKKHQVRCNLEATSISGDKDAMTSVLINLLQNAAKYSSESSLIQINLATKGEHVILEITDEGIGITDDKKDLVFERFYRDENEMTRRSKGTGLGLFIVRYLILQHSGTIELKDNQPKGLRVCISLKKHSV